MKDLIIVGAGGMGRETAFLTERINAVKEEWNILGYADSNPELTGKVFGGYRVYESISAIEGFEGAYVICAIGSSATRRRVVELLNAQYEGLRFATLIDPSVIMGSSVTVGEGSIISVGSILTVDIEIGRHSIINTGCTVGHDAKMGDFVSLYPGVNLAGNTLINEGVELGTGAGVIQNLEVGKDSIVGAGAVVVRNIPADCTAVGCPARVIKLRG